MRSDLPKVLQPLAGRALLAYVVDYSRVLGADDICIVYGYGAELVEQEFAGENLHWALQAEQNGTGHAVLQAMPGTPDANQVLILFGDVPLLTQATLLRLLEATPARELSVLTVDMDDPTGYGRIVREGNNVAGIVEMTKMMRVVRSYQLTAKMANQEHERQRRAIDALAGVRR